MTTASKPSKSKGMSATVKFSLLLLAGAIAALNTLPYLQFAHLLWEDAIANNASVAGFLSRAALDALISLLGLTLWFCLQILEMLPQLDTGVPRKLARLISFVAYIVDVGILSFVCPIFSFPPDWLALAKFSFALYGIESIFYVVRKL